MPRSFGPNFVRNAIRDLVTPPLENPAALDALRSAVTLMVVMAHSAMILTRLSGQSDIFRQTPIRVGRLAGCRPFLRLVRRRYQVPESQHFAGAKSLEARQRSRQQAAEDLGIVIQRFAQCPGLTKWTTYKALVTGWIVFSSKQMGALSSPRHVLPILAFGQQADAIEVANGH